MKYWLQPRTLLQGVYAYHVCTGLNDLYKVLPVPEDWDGLVELLQRRPP